MVLAPWVNPNYVMLLTLVPMIVWSFPSSNISWFRPANIWRGSIWLYLLLHFFFVEARIGVRCPMILGVGGICELLLLVLPSTWSPRTSWLCYVLFWRMLLPGETWLSLWWHPPAYFGDYMPLSPTHTVHRLDVGVRHRPGVWGTGCVKDSANNCANYIQLY